MALNRRRTLPQPKASPWPWKRQRRGGGGSLQNPRLDSQVTKARRNEVIEERRHGNTSRPRCCTRTRARCCARVRSDCARGARRFLGGDGGLWRDYYSGRHKSMDRRGTRARGRTELTGGEGSGNDGVREDGMARRRRGEVPSTVASFSHGGGLFCSFSPFPSSPLASAPSPSPLLLRNWRRTREENPNRGRTRESGRCGAYIGRWIGFLAVGTMGMRPGGVAAIHAC